MLGLSLSLETLMRMLMCLLVVVGCTALAAAGRLACGWLSAVAADCEGLAGALEQRRQLEDDGKALRASDRAWREIRADMIEGRLNFDEGVEALRAENARRPRGLQVYTAGQRGRTEDERFCRLLIMQVKVVLEGDPRRPAVLARMKNEFRRRLARRAGARHRNRRCAPAGNLPASGAG
jgi:hypothetical protein